MRFRRGINRRAGRGSCPTYLGRPVSGLVIPRSGTARADVLQFDTGTLPATASPPRLPARRLSSLVAISMCEGVGVSNVLTVAGVLMELSVAWVRLFAGRQKT